MIATLIYWWKLFILKQRLFFAQVDFDAWEYHAEDDRNLCLLHPSPDAAEKAKQSATFRGDSAIDLAEVKRQIAELKKDRPAGAGR